MFQKGSQVESPRSQIPCKGPGFWVLPMGPGFHAVGPTYGPRVPGPTYGSQVPGLGSHFSGMPNFIKKRLQR